MRIVNRKINPMMIELLIGIVFYGVVGCVLLFLLHFIDVPLESFFQDDIFNILLGFFVGVAYSGFMIVHMSKTIEGSMDRDEKSATTKAWIAFGIRMGILVAVMLVMIFVKIGNVFTMLIGLFGLKLSAYMQPITHKFTEKLKKGR